MVDISALLTAGLFSDLEVICGNDRYKVHRAILGFQCDFFNNALTFKEGAEGKVNLEGDHPDVVKAMIDFFYKGKYLANRQYEAEWLLQADNDAENEHRSISPNPDDEVVGDTKPSGTTIEFYFHV